MNIEIKEDKYVFVNGVFVGDTEDAKANYPDIAEDIDALIPKVIKNTAQE